MYDVPGYKGCLLDKSGIHLASFRVISLPFLSKKKKVETSPPIFFEKWPFIVHGFGFLSAARFGSTYFVSRVNSQK